MATATSKLQIIIDVLGNPSNRGVLTDIRSGLDLVSTAFDKVGQYAQKAYQFINEGAQIELAERKFDRLAQSIGATGDALMKDLGPAVGGLISQADRMALAGDIMSLGLASTQEQAVRLTGAVSQLGADMNQVVLALTNQTTARFDQIGIAVKGFDEKLAALEAQGYSTDEAFTWAFIQQAEAQIEKVGSVADTTAGQLMILEASAKDTTDQLKELAATAVGPLVAGFNRSRAANEAVNKALLDGRISLDEWARLSIIVGVSMGENEELANKLGVSFSDVATEVKSATKEIAGLNTVSQSNIHWFEQSAGVVDFYAKRAQEAARVSYVHGQALRDESQAVNTLAGSFENVSRQASGAIQPTQNLFDLTNVNIGSPISAYIADLQWFIATGGQIEAAFQAIQDSAAPPEEKLQAAKELIAVYYDAQAELGNSSNYDAATALAETLGTTYQEARDYINGTDGITAALAEIPNIDVTNQSVVDVEEKLGEVRQTLGDISGRSYSVDVILNILTNLTGTTGTIDTGSGGQTVPIPPVTGGGAGGQTGGGGGDYAQSVGFGPAAGTVVNWYGNVVVPSADEAMAFLAMMMETGRRSNATAAAGGGYAG